MTFAITGHKGFQVHFPNGVMLSVQFGPGNYCENRAKDWHQPSKDIRWESKDAEIAMFLPNGDLYDDDVSGWQSTMDFANWVSLASNYPNKG